MTALRIVWLFLLLLTVVDDEVPGLVVVGDVSKLRAETEHFFVSLQEPGFIRAVRATHHKSVRIETGRVSLIFWSLLSYSHAR